MSKDVQGSFLGLTPLLVFVFLVLGSALITGDFSAMPILVAFMLAAGYALALNPKGYHYSMAQKIDLFCQGGAEKTIILLAVIFMLAGAFYAVTMDIGARDATVNWALSLVPISFLLPGLFVIACFIAFAMGTSMGTITALTPIAIGLADSIGITQPLAIGVVIGGAMFGDNLSFVSDTTIAATRSQGVKLKDKFKANLLIVLPAALVTMTLLMFIEIDQGAVIEPQAYDIWLVSPYLLIIACALLGMNVIGVLSVGIGCAALLGLVNGTFDLFTLLGSIQKGMGWMQNMVAIALLIGGIIGLMKAYGGIQWLMHKITMNVKTRKGAELSIAFLASFLDIVTANNTISIVSAGPIAKDLSQKYNIDPRRTASLLDIFSCGFQGLVPYGGQLLTAAALAGISPLLLVPYAFYPMLILVFGLLAILTGLPRFKHQAQDEY
jgi:Na+/H+ antiporter NhaC